MTAQGHPLTVFKRALASGNATTAWAAAHELQQAGRVDLADALALCLLQLPDEPERFERAAVRLHARICAEARGLTAAEAQLALAALCALAGPGATAAAAALSELLAVRGLEEPAAIVDRWSEKRGRNGCRGQ